MDYTSAYTGLASEHPSVFTQARISQNTGIQGSYEEHFITGIQFAHIRMVGLTCPYWNWWVFTSHSRGWNICPHWNGGSCMPILELMGRYIPLLWVKHEWMNEYIELKTYSQRSMEYQPWKESYNIGIIHNFCPYWNDGASLPTLVGKTCMNEHIVMKNIPSEAWINNHEWKQELLELLTIHRIYSPHKHQTRWTIKRLIQSKLYLPQPQDGCRWQEDSNPGSHHHLTIVKYTKNIV